MSKVAKKSKLDAGVMKQKSAKSWDIEYYRTDYESEEHWALRKRFMEVHQDKFEEDELVCLAQVFVNVEFMGCKYPTETMRMVAELSQDVAKDFREQRAKRLQRTFVTASDAAEQRAKGRKTTQQDQGTSSKQARDGRPKQRQRFGTGEWEQNTESENSTQPQRNQRQQTQSDLFKGLPYGKLVLLLNGGRCCIRNSAQRAQIKFEEKEDAAGGKRIVEYFLEGRRLITASADNQKDAKAKAFTEALQLLQSKCYSIRLNPLRDSIKIDKTNNNQVICGVIKQQADSSEDKKLDANNKGYKMMKMMGWSGGGLGSKTQGREEPVSYLLKSNRAGLGNSAANLDRSYFMSMLKNYINSEDIRELQFESSFTKEERAMLHEIASRFNLKSTSYGKDNDRRLVISKKTINNEQILKEILLNKNSAFMNRYFVQVPTVKAPEYPEHTEQLQLDN